MSRGMVDHPWLLECGITDYGRPMKPFSSKFQTFGPDKSWGIWGIFSRLSVFSINQPYYFYKKLSLYTQITNISFGLGFEFGLQIINDLDIVCP